MKILITGTSRGIGLELCRQALAKGHQVLAVARRLEPSQGLAQLTRDYPKTLIAVAADVAQDEGIKAIQNAATHWDSIDVLINNAGVMKMGTTRSDFIESFNVNSVSPFLVTQALLPQLKKGKAKVVQITSLMGSIADNGSGGYYAYRASKTALNMINQSLCKDHSDLTAVVVHPGWVQTDMGGPNAPTPLSESVTGIWRVIDGLKPADSGRFIDFRGKDLPW